MFFYTISLAAWGGDSESYPEIVFLFYGVPTAVLMLTSSLILKLSERRNIKLKIISRNAILWMSFALTTALGVLMIVILFSPRGFFPQPYGQIVLDYYLIFILPLDFAFVLVGSILAMQQKK